MALIVMPGAGLGLAPCTGVYTTALRRRPPLVFWLVVAAVWVMLSWSLLVLEALVSTSADTCGEMCQVGNTLT